MNDLRNVQLHLQSSMESDGQKAPSIPESGTAIVPTEQVMSEDMESTTQNSLATSQTIQQLENVLNECKILNSLIERKPFSTPGLLNSSIPSGSQRYSPLEVSELLNTQNKDIPLEPEKPSSSSLVDTHPSLRVQRKPTRPSVIPPTTPLRISSRSPPVTPKSPERSASQRSANERSESPHMKTIEEAFAKEEEDKAYRNFCDDEDYPQTVTVLDDGHQKGAVKSLLSSSIFGHSGAEGNKAKHHFGGR
jgi:hypothetical protein